MSSDKKLVVFDGKDGTALHSVANAHAGSVMACAWAPDGASLVTAGADKAVKVWAVGDETAASSSCAVGTGTLGDMQVGAAWLGSGAAVSLGLNGDLSVFDAPLADGGVGGGPSSVVQGVAGAFTALAFDAAAGTFLTGSADGLVCAWTADGVASKLKATTDPRKALSGGAHVGKVTGVALAAGGDRVVSTGFDDTLRVAGRADGAYVDGATVKCDAQPVGLAACGDGCVVVTNSSVATYSLAGAATGAAPAQTATVGTGAWSPTCVCATAATVLVGADDSCVYALDLDASTGALVPGSLRKVIGPLRGKVTCLAVSPDGAKLAVGDAGRQVSVWAAGGDYASVVNNAWLFHTTRVTGVAWSPSGVYVASCSLDESVRVWNVDAKAERLEYKFAHKDGAAAVAFASEDEVVSVGADGCVCRWARRAPGAASA